MRVEVAGHEVYAYTGTRPLAAGQRGIVFVHGAANDHSVWALQSRYFAGLSGKGKPQHPCAQVGGRGFAFGFEGRLRGGDEKNAFERKVLDGRQRNEEMAVVNGIERSAEECDAVHLSNND